jgi:multidrug resistance efflux pump
MNGWVTNLTVRVGNYAGTGQRQMSVIDADSYWISGYFEETRLRNIQVGAVARAELMGYPGLPLLGHVESLNRGIADSNTAPNPQGLPEVNPVFTWVRLAQRIPVRIHIDHVPDGVHLAIGETCTIDLDRPHD